MVSGTLNIASKVPRALSLRAVHRELPISVCAHPGALFHLPKSAALGIILTIIVIRNERNEAYGRAMGTKSRVLQRETRFLHCCPPPVPELSFPLWGEEGAPVREGGFCAMQENPKFVPMARPYASHIPIFLYIIMVTVFAVSIV